MRNSFIIRARKSWPLPISSELCSAPYNSSLSPSMVYHRQLEEASGTFCFCLESPQTGPIFHWIPFPFSTLPQVTRPPTFCLVFNNIFLTVLYTLNSHLEVLPALINLLEVLPAFAPCLVPKPRPCVGFL